MKQFQLSHLALYAKGWYLKTDDIWEDLKKILELDNYSPFSKMDVYNIIVSSFQDSELYRITDLKEVLTGIHPSNCWKYGYYTNSCNWVKGFESLPEYDMSTAFIHYVISSLRFLKTEDFKFATPKYKLYPKNPDISLKKVIEMFNKPLKS
jgi:hypothetical protein